MQRNISFSSPLSPSSSFQSPENKERKQHKSVIFTTLPHFADLTTHMIKNIINFSKMLAMFRALIIEDQIALLKGATFEIILIHFNMFFNEVTGIWECGPLQYCLDDAMRGEGLRRSPLTSRSLFKRLVTPVNVLISVNSLYAESESKNGMME
uniref:NR LBD domain-containing protein n=1 Tax=Sinocyclocheilus grahami TaxID=75366 RepID=A0A672TEH5_SINGR